MTNHSAAPVALLALAFLLAGCEPDPKKFEIAYGYDQCERPKLFQQCMTNLPAGPQATKYNDWDEVVEACEDAARYQSYRADKNVIKKECQG